MAVQANDIRLPVVATKRTHSVTKDVIEVAQADYLFVLRGIAAQEIAAQRQLGNKVTQLIVDGSGSKPVDQALYSVRALFLDPGSMIKAVHAAWDALMRIARVGDPATQQSWQVAIIARQSFVVTVGNTAIGDIGALTESAILANPGAPIRIIGPMVEYAHRYRFLHFLRAGMGRAITRRRKSKLSGRIKIVDQSIHQIVVRQMKRSYPSLRWSDAWIDVPNFRYVNRVPTVTVRSRTTKGLL